MHTSAQLGLFDTPPRHTAAAEPVALAIRQSRRARRLMLRCVPPHTLELVVPLRTRPAEVVAFVSAHRAWIEEAQRELAAARADWQLPSAIEFPATGERWAVVYREASRRRLAASPARRQLTVSGPSGGRQEAPALLRRWLRAHGAVVLVPWLEREARRLGLSFASVQVRLQRSRWGSCSSARAVSLNAALLFATPEQVRYLLVHELCHLEVMSHSTRYWRLVQHWEPDWRALDQGLAQAWQQLPWWLFEG